MPAWRPWGSRTRCRGPATTASPECVRWEGGCVGACSVWATRFRVYVCVCARARASLCLCFCVFVFARTRVCERVGVCVGARASIRVFTSARPGRRSRKERARASEGGRGRGSLEGGLGKLVDVHRLHVAVLRVRRGELSETRTNTRMHLDADTQMFTMQPIMPANNDGELDGIWSASGRRNARKSTWMSFRISPNSCQKTNSVMISNEMPATTSASNHGQRQ